MEIWKKTPLSYGHIEVSNYGRVKSCDRETVYVYNGKVCTQIRKGTVFTPSIASTGYYIVAIKVGTTRKKFAVHRLVASAFCEGFEPSLTVNHIDGNKLNNIPENLEWITLAENTKKAWETGLVDIRGDKHPSTKLPDIEVEKIRLSFSKGESVTSIHKKYPTVSISLIYLICQNKKRLKR